MKHTEILKRKLIQLSDEINSNFGCEIMFHQQNVKKENMSFSGGNGRIRISPFHEKYDICLRGKSLEKQMYRFMRILCGRKHDSYKQTKPDPHAPFWRVSDFELVKKAVYHYAKTRK